MEHNSDLVAAGKYIHEKSYKRENKEIRIDGISIDFIRKGNMIQIHEIKKSSKMEKSHEMQVLYYLYVLKEKGIKADAILDYPLIRKKKHITLDEENETSVKAAMSEVKAIVSLDKPPSPERKRFCAKCSYYELCWSE
jgi:CRISPR-associated exonuclease Cas4